MESNRIKILLEKYWSCEATLEEERELRDWFRSQGNPGGFMEEQALFRYYDIVKNNAVLEENDNDNLIQNLGKNGQSKTVEFRPAKKNTFFSNLGVLSKIAAGIVIALAATLITLRPDLITGEEPAPKVVMLKDTFDNPEEAYAETIKALQLISKKMNMGRKETAKISIYNEAEETVKDEIIN